MSITYVGAGAAEPCRAAVARDINARDPKDLLLGTIEEGDDRQLRIKAAADPLSGIDEDLYPNLDAAMGAMSTRIEGRCEKWAPS
jgi:hypothetical protein